ncbi:hypothetical protein HPB47_016084, partial [Ixodes persulcatus]
VVERMVFKRLQRHLDVTDQMPPTMYGFRGHLCTQDVLVQLHELVIKKAKTPTPRDILALDLKGAFDNVTHEREQENVRITIDGANIAQTTQARILGVIFQNNGKAGASIDKIKAFVTSRIVYAAPYLKLLKIDWDQLNVIIRKATKMALGMPRHSSTNKLLGMAKHNVVEELIEAHLSNQRVRLSQTSAGRRVLARLGWQEADRKETGPLPRLWAHKIDSKPLPRNMRPGRNDGRRAARIAALTKTLDQIEEEKEGVTLYTDASLPRFSSKATLAVMTRDALVTCASINTSFPEVAEEAAIALALAQLKVGRIVTDSQKAYNSYRKGWVSLAVLDILKRKRNVPERKVEFIWTPAHSGLGGNELAHQFAREMEHRVEEGSFPHPYLQNKMYPERYKKECNFCKNQLGTLQHVIGVCDFVKPIPPALTIPTAPPHPSSSLTERWETLLTSPVLEDQLVLISRGQAAREAYGSRDEGTTSIDGV